jgi:hypothetical protein
MTDRKSDRNVEVASEAAKVIIDGRNPLTESASVLVTAEHVFATVLLTCMNGDARRAARMLNEGLVQGIERRLARYASSKGN